MLKATLDANLACQKTSQNKLWHKYERGVFCVSLSFIVSPPYFTSWSKHIKCRVLNCLLKAICLNPSSRSRIKTLSLGREIRSLLTATLTASAHCQIQFSQHIDIKWPYLTPPQTTFTTGIQTTLVVCIPTVKLCIHVCMHRFVRYHLCWRQGICSAWNVSMHVWLRNKTNARAM